MSFYSRCLDGRCRRVGCATCRGIFPKEPLLRLGQPNEDVRAKAMAAAQRAVEQTKERNKARRLPDGFERQRLTQRGMNKEQLMDRCKELEAENKRLREHLSAVLQSTGSEAREIIKLREMLMECRNESDDFELHCKIDEILSK